MQVSNCLPLHTALVWSKTINGRVHCSYPVLNNMYPHILKTKYKKISISILVAVHVDYTTFQVASCSIKISLHICMYLHCTLLQKVNVEIYWLSINDILKSFWHVTNILLLKFLTPANVHQVLSKSVHCTKSYWEKTHPKRLEMLSNVVHVSPPWCKPKISYLFCWYTCNTPYYNF